MLVTTPPSPEDLLPFVSDGSVVAIGGAGLTRKPMGLIRALARSDAVNISVVSFLGSVDVEFLIAAEMVSEVHTSGTSLEGMGLAPRFRSARQDGSPRVIEWSEGALGASLEAGALRLGSMPCTTSPRSDVVRSNPNLSVVSDPFSGEETVFARAIVPDIAFVQASAVDAVGNLYIDGDPGIDAVVAKAARVTVASALSVEDREPRAAAISRIWVDKVFVDADGAWPTACYPGPPADLGAVSSWANTKGADPTVLERSDS